VTALADTHVPERAYQEVAAHFSQQEIAALVALIVTINAWNAIGVSTRTWVPGSYQPLPFFGLSIGEGGGVGAQVGAAGVVGEVGAAACP
jgi:hypothetical protein